MKIIDTAIADVKILEPQVFGDERGFFMETWREDWFNTHVCEAASFRTITLNPVRAFSVACITRLKILRVSWCVWSPLVEVFDVAVDMQTVALLWPLGWRVALCRE